MNTNTWSDIPVCDKFKHSVPPWLLERFRRLIAADFKLYEASFGGCVNNLLAYLFDPKLQYMIKPQARLRSSGSHGQNIPETSTASTHKTKDSYGSLVDFKADDPIPDFVVCGATEDLHRDHVYLIWEMKRNAALYTKNRGQMDKYEHWLQEYQITRHAETICTVLMEGGNCDVTVTQPDGLGNNTWVYQNLSLPIFSEEMHDVMEGVQTMHASWCADNNIRLAQ